MISQLFVYLAGIGAVYYALLVRSIAIYRGKVFAAIGLLFLGSIAIFRGAVGTDTANYENMVAVLRYPASWYGVEPGFAALAWALSLLTPSDTAVVRLLAVVFLIGILIYLYRADRDEMFFLLAYFIPVSYYQYSMNALRIGMATVFLLLAVQCFRRGRLVSGYRDIFFGLLFHYSFFFSASYLLFMGRLLSARTLMIFVVVGAVFSSIILLYYGGYLLGRVGSYGSMGSPGKLSGLSILVVVSILLVGASLSSLGRIERLFLVLSGFLLMIFFWLIARYTYAGLRFLDLISVVFPLVLLQQHGRAGVFMNRKTKFSMLLAGVIGVGASLRGFLLGAGEGRTPWIPYEWVF